MRVIPKISIRPHQFIAIIVLVLSFDALSFERLGNDIDGDFIDGRTGYCVACNANGSIIAFASKNSDDVDNPSSVKVYKWTKYGWRQLGKNIVEQEIQSLNLSADGSILVISSYNNKANDINQGQVKTYYYSGEESSWVIFGDIRGSRLDNFGCSTSLSSDGSILAIGAFGRSWERIWKTDWDRSKRSAGYVEVYERINNSWKQLGSTIIGENAGDESGFSVELSADGKILAIGAPLNHSHWDSELYVDMDSNVKQRSIFVHGSGHVRVYEWNGHDWKQLGEDLEGLHSKDGFGHSVSLSADGTILAVGAMESFFPNLNNSSSVSLPLQYGARSQRAALFSDIKTTNDSGYVQVFEWNGHEWYQKGKNIQGLELSDAFGWDLNLSADGSFLVVGVHGYDGIKGVFSKNAGGVGLFRYSEYVNQWSGRMIIEGEMAHDAAGYAVDSSDSAEIIVVGSPGHDGKTIRSGGVSVYKFQ